MGPPAQAAPSNSSQALMRVAVHALVGACLGGAVAFLTHRLLDLVLGPSVPTFIRSLF